MPPPSGSPSPGRAPPCGTSIPEPVLPLAFGPRQEERSAEQSGSRETENQGRAAGATARIDGPTGTPNAGGLRALAYHSAGVSAGVSARVWDGGRSGPSSRPTAEVCVFLRKQAAVTSAVLAA